MPSKEQTITERIEACAHATSAAKRNIEEAVDQLEECEKHLPRDAQILAYYKTLLRMIRHETKYL